MPFIGLNLQSMADLDDGRVAKAFLHELKRCVQDCIDRPGDKNSRVVTMEFNLTPIPNTANGLMECDGVEGQFKIKGKVPVRKTKAYPFRCNVQGQLSFSSESPENPDQTTFNDINPKTGKVDRAQK